MPDSWAKIGTHNGIIGLHRIAGDAGHQLRRGYALGGIDAGFQAKQVVPHFQHHHDFFQADVAGLDYIHPSLSSCRATRTFSSLIMATPGDCSPSRRVVSNTTMRLLPGCAGTCCKVGYCSKKAFKSNGLPCTSARVVSLCSCASGSERRVRGICKLPPWR